MQMRKIFVPVVLLVCLLWSGAVVGDSTNWPASDEFVAVEVYPEMVHQEKPECPPGMTDKKGTVWVKALVDTGGEVVKAEIGRSSGVQQFDEAALTAAFKCRFKPGQQDGRPVALWVTYKVEFTPENSPDEPTTNSMAAKELADRVKVGRQPEAIRMVEPVYPEAEEKAGKKGTVWVRALVSSTGKVAKAEVAKSSGIEAFDKAAIEAAYKCTYKPAVQEGEKVSVWITYKVHFSL